MLVRVFCSKREGKMKSKKIFVLLLSCLLSLLLESCEQTNIIYTEHDLLSLLNSLDYSYLSVHGGKLTVTDNIVIIGTITISSKQLNVPEECSSIAYCREMVSFDKRYESKGISLKTTDNESFLILSNVKLRFRPLIINRGGPPPPADDYMKYPEIELLPPSDYQCDNASIKCDVDKVCYENYDSYCLYCEQLTQFECNCRDEDGLYPDGTYCMIVTGDDTYINGQCKSGRCEG